MNVSQTSNVKRQKFGRKEQKMLLVFFLSFLVFSSLFSIASADAATGINKTINFQGKLVNSNGTNVSDNTYSIVFTLYNASSGGTNLWTEIQSVTTSDGVFQVALGSVTSLAAVNFNSDTIYLGIKVGSDSEMTPRVRFTGVPYAFNADKLNGVTATQSATGFNLQSGSSSLSTVSFTTSGSTLTLQPGVAGGLTIQSNGANGLTLDTGGAGALNLGTTNATSAVLGSSTLGSFTVTTDGTGDNELVLPAQSIGASEIVNDGLDFAHLADSQTLDAGTTVSFGGNDYIFDLTSTGNFNIRDAGNNFAQFLADGTITFGKAASGGTINLGIGTGADTINIGSDNTVGDTLAIGNNNSSTTLALTGGTAWSISAAGTAVLGSLTGAGLSDCDAAASKLLWNDATGTFSCGTEQSGSGADVQFASTVIGDITLGGSSTSLGTVSVTPTNNSGDILVRLTFSTRSLNNSDQTITAEIRSGANCSGTLLASNTTSLTSSNGSNGPSVNVIYLHTNAGNTSHSYTACGLSSSANGTGTTGGLISAEVIDTSPSSGGAGNVAVRESDGSPSVSTATTIEFGPDTTSSDEFIVTDQGSGIARIRTGDMVGMLNQAEIITGGWTFNTTQTTFGSLIHANEGIDTSIVNQNLILSANGSGHIILSADNNTFVGIGTTTPTVTLDVRGQVGTTPAASVSARTSFAGLLVDNAGVGDLFTASKGGTPTFTVTNVGQILSSNYRVGGGILYADTTGKFLQTTAGNLGECLQSSGGGVPTWGVCGSGGGSSAWDVVNGAITPKFASTVDLLLGGTSTDSAKFAVLGINSGTPTASISAPSTGYALSFNANGSITTTQGQTLNLGGGDSGEVYINSLLHIDPTMGIRGGGLSDCSSPTTSKLLWDSTTNHFSCGTDQGGGGGSSMTVRESDSSPAVPAVALLEFGPASTSSDEFIVTDEGSNIARVRIGNQVGMLNQAETVTGGWTFNTIQTTFGSLIHANGGIDTSTSNTNLSLAANGSGHIVLNTDSNTGILIGSSGNVIAPLSVNGGIGSNALAILNQTNSGDILAASAAGVTRFTIKNDGTASTSAGLTIDGVGSIQSTKGQTLTIGGNTTGDILFQPNQSTGLRVSGNSTVSLTTATTAGLTLDTGGAAVLSIGTTNASSVVLGKATNGSSTTIDTGTGGLNIGDSANTKVIEIGGVDNNGADTVRIATNATSADAITIGNANASTTMALAGGDAWSITTAGLATFTKFAGSGLSDCDAAASKLLWDSTNQTFSCGTDMAGSDSQRSDTSLSETTLGNSTTLIGTVSITPSTATGDVFVRLELWTKSSSNTDQTITAEIRSGANCSGTLLDSNTALLTSGNGSNGPGVFVSYLSVDAGTSAQTYAACALSSSNNGASTGGSLTAEVIDTGADYAELYTTNDVALEAGDIVALDATLKAGVKKTQKAYDPAVIGVVATHPGQVIGSVEKEGVNALPVALAGRVPVKVSTENGPIFPGDFLTPSSIPGVAMKTTEPGFVIGQVMTGYSGEEVGVVTAFIKNQFYDPGVTWTSLDNFTLSPSASNSAQFSLADSMDQTVSRVGAFSQVAVGNIQIGYGVAQHMTIDGYLNVKDNITAGILTVGDITTNSLTVTSENISVGGQTFRDYIASIVLDVLSKQSQTQQSPTVISGLLLVESGIKNQESRIKDLEAVLATTSAVLAESTVASESAEARDTRDTLDTRGTLSLDSLNVDGLATISSTLRVKQNGLVEGVLTVIDTLMTRNLVVSGLATFLDRVVFKGDVSFNTPPTFSKDTAGFAIIKKDSDRVEVFFDKPYKEMPIVNVSLSLDEATLQTNETEEAKEKRQSDLEQAVLGSDISYIVTKRTNDGFTILLNKPANDDLPFSWTALSVSDPQTFESKLIEPSSTPIESGQSKKRGGDRS